MNIYIITHFFVGSIVSDIPILRIQLLSPKYNLYINF